MPRDDRRQFRRVQAPVYCSSMGLFLFQDRTAARDISLGGLRVYSDQPFKKGTRLELEVFLPGGRSITCQVEVAWCAALVDDVAPYDVGMSFIKVSDADLAHLASVLDDSPSSTPDSPDSEHGPAQPERDAGHRPDGIE